MAPKGATPCLFVIIDFDDPLHPVGRCAQWAQGWDAQVHQAHALVSPLSRSSHGAEGRDAMSFVSARLNLF